MLLAYYVMWHFLQAYYFPQQAYYSLSPPQVAVFYVAADNVQNYVPMKVLCGRHCQPFFENFHSHICGEGVMWVTPILFYEVNLIKK